MACDEAVLAQSCSPRLYAQCLARLAEKTMMRRKLALAQGIVNRVRQLSLRVAQILDADRPTGTRLWKPAVSLVMLAAVLCGFSAWSLPSLISFESDTKGPTINRAEPSLLIPSNVKASAGSSLQPRLVLAAASFTHATQSPGVLRHALRMRPRPKPAGDYVVHAEQLIFAVPATGRAFIWQVSMWQVRIQVPADDPGNKIVSRKNI
jgi:hypothetical protein